MTIKVGDLVISESHTGFHVVTSIDHNGWCVYRRVIGQDGDYRMRRGLGAPMSWLKKIDRKFIENQYFAECSQAALKMNNLLESLEYTEHAKSKTDEAE